MPNEHEDMTDHDMRVAEVGTIVSMSCSNCEGGERHQKQSNAKWKCLWCSHEEIEFC